METRLIQPVTEAFKRLYSFFFLITECHDNQLLTDAEVKWQLLIHVGKDWKNQHKIIERRKSQRTKHSSWSPQ